jgi:hypothetical protein
VIGYVEHAAETFEGETLETCLELSCGGGDGESSFASIIILGAHFIFERRYILQQIVLWWCLRPLFRNKLSAAERRRKCNNYQRRLIMMTRGTTQVVGCCFFRVDRQDLTTAIMYERG